MLKCKQSKIKKLQQASKSPISTEKVKLQVIDEVFEESKEDCKVEEYSLVEDKRQVEPFDDREIAGRSPIRGR